jgi:cytoskeletal protein CcmA (bactofilin family)
LANIGKSISIKGDLTGNEDLVIDGNIEGRIDLPNNQLTIGAEGKIKADIHAKSAVLVGHVTGNVSATERIEVQASGIVDGDVRAPRLVVQEGAVLNGTVEMSEAKRQAPAEPLRKAGGGGDSLPSQS